MTQEFYKAHRPKTFDEVVGQRAAVSQLEKMVEGNRVPHTLIFSGPSGCGKTTLARIMATELNCGDFDFNEMNCADVRGIDAVRQIRSVMGLAPRGGDCRIWLVDEAHQLTNDAQNAFLKMLEDTPRHVYFFLCTTDSQKLLKTIRTRGTEIKVSAMPDDDVLAVLRNVVKASGVKISKEVAQRIVEQSEGSARKALVLMDQIANITDEEEQIAILSQKDIRSEAIMIARTLMRSGARWQEMATILKTCNDDAEGIRRLVMSYAASVLMNGKQDARAYKILVAFSEPFFNTGKPGLVASCYEVMCE